MRRVLPGVLLMTASFVMGDDANITTRATLPFNDARIDYENRELNVVLNDRINRAVELAQRFQSPRERLERVLQELDIPVESQVLVFSKTSTNGKLVSPANPRAIFFNDEMAVAWVPGGPSFELSIHDPILGEVFATVPIAEKPTPGWKRQSRCLQCHVAGETHGVPGMLLKSVATDSSGKPIRSLFDNPDDAAWEHAWGGWYVSAERSSFSTSARGLTLGSEPFDTNAYPLPGSDPVAILVLQHQSRVLNLLTRYRYESLLGKRFDSEQSLVRALLCLDETPFPVEVKRTPFAEAYETRKEPGETRRFGLRRLNLRDRLYESGVSPLILSRTIRSYPWELRKRLAGAIREQLGGNRKQQRIEEAISWMESRERGE
ncbi:MAG: hypothetical protein KDA36_02185 [Planctomycetaceae bacterium]|nr:hypothetical protein [Planctomycetaceae bacterium]